VSDGLAPGGIGRGDQVPAGLAPALDVAARREHLAVAREDGAPSHLGRDLLQIGDGPAGIGYGRGVDGSRQLRAGVAERGTWSKIASVTLEQGSWLTVVIVCGISVVLLAIGGYTGYSIVVGAVGLAAAVNLL
jgi:hypothetical protein